jgi:tRNA(Ile)-lysidine synthase
MFSENRPLDAAIRKCLLPLRGQSILLAFSGGLDSLALAHGLSILAPLYSVNWAIAHVHHGPTRDAIQAGEQHAYRDAAAVRARQIATDYNVAAYIIEATTPLGDSEASLREFRRASLEGLRIDHAASRLFLAHHQDDLLETRVMRLLRGTGLQGLSAMQGESAHVVRPFLQITRAQIEAYARVQNLVPLEDPSNQNSDYLRNWIRNEWLPQLEARSPGAMGSLARSLDQIVAAPTRPVAVSGPTIDRKQFRELSAADQKAVVAQKLLSLGARDFSQTHVEEIVKRLDTVQKRLEFRVAHCLWSLNAQQIFVSHDRDALEV